MRHCWCVHSDPSPVPAVHIAAVLPVLYQPPGRKWKWRVSLLWRLQVVYTVLHLLQWLPALSARQASLPGHARQAFSAVSAAGARPQQRVVSAGRSTHRGSPSPHCRHTEGLGDAVGAMKISFAMCRGGNVEGSPQHPPWPSLPPLPPLLHAARSFSSASASCPPALPTPAAGV